MLLFSSSAAALTLKASEPQSLRVGLKRASSRRMMKNKFFYAVTCPLADECNPANFKSWNPWGWTEEACRAQVLKHLMSGGKHKENCPKGEHREELYKMLVESMELEEAYYEPQQPGKKRPRSPEADDYLGPQRWPRQAPPLEDRDDRQAQMNRLLQGMSSNSHGSSHAAPVTRQDLREVSDSLNRCITSANHAQRLSSMAARAFQDEASVFEDVKAFIDVKMSQMPE